MVPEGPPHTPTRTLDATSTSAREGREATWESMLSERVQALEGAHAGAQAEAAALRQQLSAAREHADAGLGHLSADQVRQEASAVQARLQAQLDQAHDLAEARRGEAAAAGAVAEALRQRQAEQEHWLGRRAALLESAHREVGSLQQQLAAANAATREAAAEAEATGGGVGGVGGGGRAAAAALEGIEAAAYEGRMAALHEQVAALQVEQQSAAAAASAALAEERASFLQARGRRW